MRFISAQPDSDYFIWQLRVQINNFKKFNIEKDCIVLLGYEPARGINPEAQNFADSTEATVIFFEDIRSVESKKYIPTIRPHLLKKFFDHFSRSPILSGQDIFYHDSDIIFASLPDFKKLRKKNKILLSDTISYIGADYIKAIDASLLKEMTEIVGIDSKIVEKNQNKSGGAQYFIPYSYELDYAFWDKVEKDSHTLYTTINAKKTKLQIWTSDMWCVLWNFWIKDYKTAVDKDLEFSWATSPIESWSKCHIYHNAGAVPERKDLFYKAAYIQSSPFLVDHQYVSKDFCSFKYVEEISEVSRLLNSK